ncbi:MAG: lysylphosphatidylglycerol synthase domain-containing protein [Telluria sp.]
MRRAAILAGVAGLLLLTALVLYEGLPAIAGALDHAGWPLLLLVPAHLAPLLFDTQAWRTLLAPINRDNRAGPLFLLWVSAVREAVARLLPSVGIGGEVVGVRLARLRLPDTAAVTASIVLEVLVTIGVLYLFAAIGLVIMAQLAAARGEVGMLAAALLVTLPLPLLLVWLLRRSLVFTQLHKFVRRVLGEGHQLALQLDGARLDAEIVRHFAHPKRIALAFAWQFPGYLLGAFETWYALYLLGHPVGASAAIAIEALTQAARHATFLVPAGVGVQEAAVVLFGYVAGISGEVALSLALVKRMREILFGVPALLSWQWVEARRLRPD